MNFSITLPIKITGVFAKSSFNDGLMIHEHERVDPMSMKINNHEYIIVTTIGMEEINVARITLRFIFSF